jgi:photosystem II stability/assembly factor-like uncharacterized protein
MTAGREPPDEKLVAAIRAFFDGEQKQAQSQARQPGPQRRPARSTGRLVRSAAIVAIAAIVLGVTFRLVVVQPDHRAAATGSPEATAVMNPAPKPSVPSSETPMSPAPPFLSGTVGLNGGSAWVISGSVLNWSADGGRNWSAAGLPPGVSATDLMSVSGAPGRAIWLAVREGAGVRLHRYSYASAWTSTPLIPSWPSVFQVSGPLETAIVTPGPAGLVTVAETVGIGTSSAFTTLFISTDDGRTFARHPPQAGVGNEYWWSVTFSTPQNGVVALGPETGEPSALIHTFDSGRTWAEAAISGLPTHVSRSFGKPAIVGAEIVVPVTTRPDDAIADRTLNLLVSTDGGASFAATGTALGVGAQYTPVTETLGKTTWVIPNSGGGGQTIFETTDLGKTWTSVEATGLDRPYRISLTGRNSAIAVTLDGYLVATIDGGKTWTAVQR